MELAYAEAGQGGRPLLLVHGFTGAKEDFTEWLEPLAERGWHAVAPDNRGHGDSPKPEGVEQYSFALLTSDLVELVDARWGPSGRFVLLGHSMGGMLAQFLAVEVGDRLDGLVLMDTSPSPLAVVDRETATTGGEIAMAKGMDAIADLLAELASPLDTPAHLRVVAERPDYAEFNERKLRTVAPGMYAAMLLEMMDQPDRVEALSTLRVPTLVIVGDQDRPFIAPSQRMADAIPGARLAVIEDAGHSPQFENPKAWWDALDEFLSSLP
jgi:pimeloyl-ACP methyl ester carboxylesterase